MIQYRKDFRNIKPISLFDDIYHICIGLLPVLYILRVPGINLSLSTVIFLGFVPLVIVYIISGITQKMKADVVCFFVFYIYMVLRADGNTTRIIMCIVSFLHLWGMANGTLQSKKIRKIVEEFSLINVVLLIIQVISYYILHFRIQYIPQGLIYQEYQESYVFNNVMGLYRPSALFLEPSHFSQFCIFALISMLFPVEGKVNIKRALAIAMGCILTTSGMGIVLTFAVFVWYALINSNQGVGFNIVNIIKWTPVLVIGALLLSRISFFQAAISRVFSSMEGYNAVSGRIHNWYDAIGNMRGKELWYGYGDSKNYKWYLTGIIDFVYKYGIISVLLQTACLIYLMLKKKTNFVWCCCIVFLGLFCVAHLTNFVSQVFYFGFVIADIVYEPEKRC